MDFLSFLPVLHLKVQIILTVKHIYTGFNSSSLVDTDCDAELMWWSSALLCYTYTSGGLGLGLPALQSCTLHSAPTSGFPHRHQP